MLQKRKSKKDIAKDISVSKYRKHTRELKATRPKEIMFEDDFNFMKLTLKY